MTQLNIKRGAFRLYVLLGSCPFFWIAWIVLTECSEMRERDWQALPVILLILSILWGLGWWVLRAVVALILWTAKGFKGGEE